MSRDIRTMSREELNALIPKAADRDSAVTGSVEPMRSYDVYIEAKSIFRRNGPNNLPIQDDESILIIT